MDLDDQSGGNGYVHGYADREGQRLLDQAATLNELLHAGTRYPPGASVLEAGCGVGAQTVTLAANSPQAQFSSIDISPESVRAATAAVSEARLANVEVTQGDIFDLRFGPESFDHVFVCFVLEHLPDPVGALTKLKAVLKMGGTITVIEGDHGSTFFHPASEHATAAVRCQVELQHRSGGNALIGRELFPLLHAAGFTNTVVSPRAVYVDDSRPEWIEGFTKNTFIAMVEGIRTPALNTKLMSAADFDQGLADLRRTTEPGGTFCYTFFKATATNPSLTSESVR
jgi:SAM-dependent methyltransferase